MLLGSVLEHVIWLMETVQVAEYKGGKTARHYDIVC